MSNGLGEEHMYKKQERMLIWLAFLVAAIMGLSFIGRIFAG
jgi:hypothetical protein